MATEKRLVRFHGYEFDQASLELRQNGEAVRLPLQPSRALALLVENAGSLVTRERFHRYLWPESFVALDQGLNTCIRQLRSTLGDDAEAPVFIETVPRRGYRFIAPVHAIAEKNPEAVSSSGGWTRRWKWSLAAGLVMAAMAVGVWTIKSSAAFSPIRLAILPFQAIGTDEAGQLFSDGLTEELITTMAGVDPERLLVTARASAAKLDGRYSAAEIGETLGVDFYLEGSIRPSGDGYRVSARLVEVASEATVWAEQHDRSVDEHASVQEWLASRVSSAVMPAVLEPTGAARREPLTEVLVPWLMARHLLNRNDPAEAERSIPLLHEVLSTDTEFAPAHVSLARAYLQLQRTPEAEAALIRAFELDPEHPEAFFVRGQLRLFQWRLEEAGRDLERAARTGSGDSRIHDYFAYYLAITGRHEEARQEMIHATEIDPIASAIFSDAGLFHYWAGRPQAAAADCEQALKVALPQYRVRAHRCLIHAYEAAGRLDRARDHALAILEAAGADMDVRRSMSETPDPRIALSRYWHWAARAENLLMSQGSTAPYARARAMAAMGNMEATIRALEEALEVRDPSLVQIGVEPRFSPIRDDARFRAVAQAVGIPSR